MPNDTRTESERRYDAERDGSLYVKPAPDLVDAVLNYVTELPIADRLEREAGARLEAMLAGCAAPPVEYRCLGLSGGSVAGHMWDEYSCGTNILNIDDGAFTLRSKDSGLGEWTAAELAELRALLNDARVVAAIEAPMSYRPDPLAA
jgi:hypothetical protein